MILCHFVSISSRFLRLTVTIYLLLPVTVTLVNISVSDYILPTLYTTKINPTPY